MIILFGYFKKHYSYTFCAKFPVKDSSILFLLCKNAGFEGFFIVLIRYLSAGGSHEYVEISYQIGYLILDKHVHETETD